MSGPNFANISNVELIEGLYSQYLQDPVSVDSSWRFFFQGMEFNRKEPEEKGDIRSYLMVETFRRYGHLAAKVNPLNGKETLDQLSIEKFGFSEEDLGTKVETYGVTKEKISTLENLYQVLEKTYCSRIGYEFMHSENIELKEWLQEQLEIETSIGLTKEERKKIVEELNRSEVFETFLHTKFVGQKRFSLEGCETLIPILYSLIECGSKNGIQEVVLGMAHRGRLNVLVNLMNKSYAMIFHEFDQGYIPKEYEKKGDVKYHKGFSRDYVLPSGEKIHLHLAANPSHLEAVNPVVLGQTRAKQDLRKTSQVETVLIHGDASLAGQGVVYEAMQLSKLEGYQTNGSIHVVINNQIGFTTLPEEDRSTRYCTDISKAFDCVVFHVNAEDPEACIYVSRLACQIREKFHTDVFIDLIGYRKYGHNEADEPFFTQPIEYALIKEKKSIKNIYQDWLLENNLLEKEVIDLLENEFRNDLQKALDSTKDLINTPPEPEEMMGGYWKDFVQPSDCTIFDPVDTKVSIEDFQGIVKKITTVPESFHFHPKLAKMVEERAKVSTLAKDQKAIEWGFAEQLAFSSILKEGIPIRLTGQDVRRGTFNHRHVMWVDQQTGERYFPLSGINESTFFDVYNSPLSEYAALGYEYGYSLSNPKAMVLWEAQFGDFCNGAQIIIDQFISSSEEKWSRYTSITMLLPHGYEGQGPEHSSGRMERFLELCGQNNMMVVNPSTPAQYFHILRIQAKRPLKKPLIVFTPKSLLRLPACKSSVEELTEGEFSPFLDDPKKVTTPRKLLFCSGKIYYELDAYREKNNITDVAIVRVEQLFPFHDEKATEIFSKYRAQTVSWVQEEPKNIGAFTYIFAYLRNHITEKTNFEYIGRRASASPASGSSYIHKQEQTAIVTQAFE